MNIEIWMDDRKKVVEKYMFDNMKIIENKQKKIYEAMLYSLDAGGKRLRPLLMIGTYEMISHSNSYEEVLPFATAMEMIHTYSLIHDDLPAMDDDDLRRGRPSNHKKFDEATAILAGDALLNKAFEIMSKSCKEAKNADDMRRKIEAMETIANSSGTEGMIGGQIIDIFGHDLISDIDELINLQRLKTGAIIISSCLAGAILAGANQQQLELVKEFASKLGTAFQIQDDILDVTADESELGKPVGSDADEDKVTFVTMTSLEEAEQMQVELSRNAISIIREKGLNSEFLIELTEFLIARRK